MNRDRLTLIVLVCLIGAGWLLARCGSPAPDRLPPKVEAAVNRHEALTVVDTAAVHRLERAAARSARSADSARKASAAAELAAKVDRDRADSLLAAAAAAKTAADSAEAYRQAEIASRRRADSLQSALVAQRAATAAAEERANTLEVAKSIETTRANRADDVVADVIPVATGRSCRIARVLTCPTRTQVAIGGVVAGVILTGVAEGKIRVRLPF